MEIKLIDNEISIRDCYHQKEVIKNIPGRRWDPSFKAWYVPLNLNALESLKQIAGQQFTPVLVQKYSEMKKIQEETEKERFANNEPVEPMPINKKPFAHQVRAYNMACLTMGIFERSQRSQK